MMTQRDLICERCGKSFTQISEGAARTRKYCNECQYEVSLERSRKITQTEKRKEYMRHYLKAHPEKFRAASRKYQAKKYREEKLKAFKKVWKSEEEHNEF